MTRPALLEQRRPQKPVQNLEKGRSMDTLHQPTISTLDPETARYFRAICRAADEEAARLGLPPEPFRFAAA
jgi:hypothetical protein